jgi:hypothetical protein
MAFVTLKDVGDRLPRGDTSVDELPKDIPAFLPLEG